MTGVEKKEYDHMVYDKELDYKEILSEAWFRFRDNFKSIMIITLLIYIPINIILSLIPIDSLIQKMGNYDALRTYLRILQLLESFIGVLATMAIAYLVRATLNNKEMTWQEAIQESFSHWGAVVSTGLLRGIFLIGLFILLIVPGIIYSVYWVFMVYAVALLEMSGMTALKHSEKIVRGRWTKVFAYALLFGVMATVMSAGIGFINSFLPDTEIINITINTLIDIIGSFFVVVFTVFFLNFNNTIIEPSTIKPKINQDKISNTI